MRSVVVAFATAAFVAGGLLGCTRQQAAPQVAAVAQDKARTLEGAWELVSAQYTPGEGGFSVDTQRQIKLLTKDHWAFLVEQRNLPKTPGGTAKEWADAAKSFSAGGGSYTLDGDTYTEHIEFFVEPKIVGTSIAFKIKWEGDEWTQTGTLPLKALGLADHDVELQERYRRIK